MGLARPPTPSSLVVFKDRLVYNCASQKQKRGNVDTAAIIAELEAQSEESAPHKGLCKPLKTENFPSLFSLKNSNSLKPGSGPGGATTWVRPWGSRLFGKERGRGRQKPLGQCC